jgi:hypothetical protein
MYCMYVRICRIGTFLDRAVLTSRNWKTIGRDWRGREGYVGKDWNMEDWRGKGEENMLVLA